MSAGRNVLRALIAGAAALAMLTSTNIAHAEPTLPEIEKQIETASDALETVIETYNKVNEELKATQAAAADLATRMQPLQTELDKAYANVDKIAAAAYKGGSNLRTVSVLLSAKSSDSFIDQLSTLEQISRTQRRQVAGYAEARGKFEAEKKNLDQLLANQNAQKAELETKKVTVEAELKKLQDLKRRSIAAGSRPATTTTVKAGPPPAVSGAAGKAVSFAYAQLGKPYKWGGEGPGSYDCSGLTMMAWRTAGVSLPHNAEMQWNKVRKISRSALAPGDLVFYRNLAHVGIYIGNGNIIHAPTSGDVVKIAGVDRQVPYGYGRPG